MPKISLFVVLMAFYAVLSGQFENSFLMIVGAIACLAIAWLSRHMELDDDEGLPIRWWPALLTYTPWLLWQVILANIDVAKRVWSVNQNINPQLIRVPHRLRSAFGISTYANSITLTPGTVTVEIGEREFIVHALSSDAADDLLSGEMHDRVKALEDKVLGPASTSNSSKSEEAQA